MDIVSIIKVIFLGLALLGGAIVSVLVPRRYHDTRVEEVSEKIIHGITGFDVDLTPDSPETDYILTPTETDTLREDNWHHYFDEYSRVKEYIDKEEGFPDIDF